jgi:quercetin dioxygenase-like cupin family protein
VRQVARDSTDDDSTDTPLRAVGRVTFRSTPHLRCLAFRFSRQEEFVERFSFTSDVAFVPRGNLLEHVTVAPLTPSIVEGSLIQAAIFRVAPGGGLGRHPATYSQILAVLEGSGVVSGQDGIEEPIVTGEAVFWREGEEHETRSTNGLTALILEGQSLDRFRARPASPQASS